MKHWFELPQIIFTADQLFCILKNEPDKRSTDSRVIIRANKVSFFKTGSNRDRKHLINVNVTNVVLVVGDHELIGYGMSGSEKTASYIDITNLREFLCFVPNLFLYLTCPREFFVRVEFFIRYKSILPILRSAISITAICPKGFLFS